MDDSHSRVKRFEWLDDIVIGDFGLVGQVIQRTAADLEHGARERSLGDHSVHPTFRAQREPVGERSTTSVQQIFLFVDALVGRGQGRSLTRVHLEQLLDSGVRLRRQNDPLGGIAPVGHRI